jgi:hypothetical protein
MKQRTNAGYTIIATIQLPNQEYVLGEKQMESREPKYVTWYCVDKKNYYHGHYIDDKNVALRDLYERVNHEIAYRIDRLNEKIKGE